MKFETKVIHAGIHPDPTTGAIMTPIYQTSTYALSVQAEGQQHYAYSRTNNPTRQALEHNLAALENGNYAICFASGMAAINGLLQTLKSGDEIISTNDLYGGSYRLFTQVFERYGIKTHFVRMDKPGSIEPLINSNTRLIWIETPTNPMLNIIDIPAVCSLAQKHQITTCVDNTFATPYLQRPLDLGADIVMHSATKYLGGHSDILHGVLIRKDKKIADKLYFIQNAAGAVPGPQDCFLLLRGIKTLHLRVERACQNATKIAGFLQEHPAVRRVFYPGLSSHPGHTLAQAQMRAFGAMMSFSLQQDNTASALKVLNNTHLFTCAESLGGVESLVGHPATMTHASIPRTDRLAIGLCDSLIRLSVGIEAAEDLIEDLKKALDTLI